MRKLTIAIFMVFACCVTAVAQQAKIGYFSYKAILEDMPDYVTAMLGVETLRKQYDEELKAASDEFNEKYELFLDQQSMLDEPIKQKRQADLQSLLDRNTQFRNESMRLLRQAEQDALAPVKQKLNKAIQSVGYSGAFLLIVNTDSEACPYIDSNSAEDVTAKIKSYIR
ncbi:MAG: OmpH family outer membrane protein [Prevotella sp.]|nr:OmpH family outer membrane protein [Prevotella sp.]MDY4160201.1 OmpH family outer membrane protein [Prevotella sp.]